MIKVGKVICLTLVFSRELKNIFLKIEVKRKKCRALKKNRLPS
jgi:hypothetical protein